MTAFILFREESRYPSFETVVDGTGRVRRRAIFPDTLEKEEEEEEDSDDDMDSDDNESDEDEAEEENDHEMEPPRKKSKVS